MLLHWMTMHRAGIGLSLTCRKIITFLCHWYPTWPLPPTLLVQTKQLNWVALPWKQQKCYILINIFTSIITTIDFMILCWHILISQPLIAPILLVTAITTKQRRLTTFKIWYFHLWTYYENMKSMKWLGRG